MVHALVSSNMTGGGGVSAASVGVDCGRTSMSGPVVVVPKSGGWPGTLVAIAVLPFLPRVRSRSRISCPKRTASASVLIGSVVAGNVGVATVSVGRALLDIAELSGR